MDAQAVLSLGWTHLYLLHYTGLFHFRCSASCRSFVLIQIFLMILSKKEGKDQELIQSSITPDSGYQWESDNVTIRHHKREPRGQPFTQQVTTRHQQTDMHESIIKQDRNNINDPQKKHRNGTVSRIILLEGLSLFNDAPNSPFVQM